MISACEKAGGDIGMINALNILQEMKAVGVAPNIITYSAAISACEKAGGEQGRANARALLKDMNAMVFLHSMK